MWNTVQIGQSRQVWPGPGKKWESLWKGGHGTLSTVKGGHWGGHWTLCPAGTPNGERCQPETLDTVFQGSQKAAKEALVFSPSYMRVSHVVIDKSINEVREIFAGNRMLELFLSGAIVRGRKIGKMGWVVK